MMEKLNQAIFWYQKKIGTYDKQPWEKTVEERVLKNIQKVPRRTTRLKSELIDVDLVRGSSFSKVKLQHGWLTVGLNGVARTIFLPFYIKWWQKQMSAWCFYCVVSLFIFQVLTLVVYFTDTGQHVGIERLSIAHILMPIVLMLIIGQIHGQVVATQLSRNRKWYSFSLEQNRQTEVKKRKLKRRTPSSSNLKSQQTLGSQNLESLSSLKTDICSDMELRQRRLSRAREVIERKEQPATNGNEGSESSDNEKPERARVHWEERKKTKLVKKSVKKKKKSPISMLAEGASMNNLSPPSSTEMTSTGVEEDAISASGLLQDRLFIVGQESNDSSPEAVFARPNCLPLVDNCAGDFLKGPVDCCDNKISPENVTNGGDLTTGLEDIPPSNGSEHGSLSSPQVPALDADWDETGDTEISAGSDSETVGSSDSAYSPRDEPAKNQESVEWRRVDAVTGPNSLDSTASRVSCLIWEGDCIQKIDLSGVDIGWSIIRKVDRISESSDFLRICVVLALVAMMVPLAFRVYHCEDPLLPQAWPMNFSVDAILHSCNQLFGSHWREEVVVANGVIQRFSLSCIYFFLLAVAERTYKQRLLYAKYFTCLTSSRRARKYDLPHFRLNKVDNIKTWLSLRSYLKRRGPQRSVDAIVTATFYLLITCLSLVCVELLRDPGSFVDYLGNWEMLAWTMILSIFLMRFMTLGSQITKKYRSNSILITEQINLYLQLQQKPHKKEELMVANNVLKLSEGLLKELDSPFRITALSANPILHNILKLVILSAFSTALSELLGFNLRLYKIKFRA